jgi:hypothetical protein
MICLVLVRLTASDLWRVDDSYELIDKPVEVRTRCVLAYCRGDIQSYSESLKSSSLEFMGRVIHADARVGVFLKVSVVLTRIMLPR